MFMIIKLMWMDAAPAEPGGVRTSAKLTTGFPDTWVLLRSVTYQRCFAFIRYEVLSVLKWEEQIFNLLQHLCLQLTRDFGPAEGHVKIPTYYN